MRARDDGREGREGRGHPREADRNKREAGEEEGQGGETGGLGATKRAITFAEFIGTAERKTRAFFLSLSLFSLSPNEFLAERKRESFGV